MPALMRYVVKRDRMAEHVSLLRAVYHELDTERPAGFHWASYRVREHPASFVEVVIGEDLPGPLPGLPAFQRYREGLDDRCDGPLEFLDLDEVGTYGMPPGPVT
ncbi:MAG: hypothetical protein ACFCVF_16825 [Kineosporiaceae bacterium]